MGSNSAGGNTDTTNASCPPSQADVNEGYVDCTDIASTGNNATPGGSYNNSSLDVFFNGQPVPQQSTAALSSGGALAGGTVSVTGGTNWWGSSGGAPNTGPYGDDQVGNMYQVNAPGVFIGTSRATAVPVTNSTVTIGGNSYACTGAEATPTSATNPGVGPNPCTMTVGQPSGSFQVPAGLASGVYNVYIDESNTTPLPGNGPNDSYQTARGTNLGTAESVTQLVIGAPVFTSGTSTTFNENSPGTFAVTATGDTPISYTETGSLPSGVTLASNGTLSGTPAFGTAGSYPITITATDANSNTTTQAFTLTVATSVPVFTSAASTTFAENSASTFSVTANGDTPIGYTESGALPSGVSLATNGTLSGTAALGTAGSYPIIITATDANSNTATQNFTLTVTATAPVFTSAASTTFAENNAGTFSVTATGDTPIGYTETGTLPSGVSLATNGTLSGTPAFGTAGSYPITITATDANANTTTQAFTLTVTATAPVFTSAHLDHLRREQRRHLLGHRHRGHPDRLHRDRVASLGSQPGDRRHPVGHPGLRHRRQLPDHHHRHRRQLQHHHPGLHPHGDRHGTGVHLGSIDYLRREQRGHLLGHRQRGHPDRLHRDRDAALGSHPWA